MTDAVREQSLDDPAGNAGIFDYVPQWTLVQSMTGDGFSHLLYRDDVHGCQRECMGKNEVFFLDGCKKPFKDESSLIAAIIAREADHVQWIRVDENGMRVVT
mgnify:CR=1 FL=1